MAEEEAAVLVLVVAAGCPLESAAKRHDATVRSHVIAAVELQAAQMTYAQRPANDCGPHVLEVFPSSSVVA